MIWAMFLALATMDWPRAFRPDAVESLMPRSSDVKVLSLLTVSMSREISADAFPYLLKNIRPFPGVKPVQADIFEVVPQLPSCHLILSNPPYLSDNEMDRLQTEVTYEPKLALRAGENGLAFYRRIAGAYREKLLPQGHIAFEVGYRQSGPVEGILREKGWRNIEKAMDYNGIERVVSASVQP